MEKHEVIIVGAGPGGLTAARALAESGKEVLVLEKAKEKDVGDKLCGGYPSNRILGHIPESLFDFAPTEFKLHLAGKTVMMRFSDGTPFARAIERKDLGQWQLKEAKKAGAYVKCDSAVSSISLKDKKATTDNGEEYEYKFLIGADGADSIVRKTLGYPTKEAPVCQYIIKKRVKEVEAFLDWEKIGFGYGWIFPHRDSTYVGVGGFPPLSLEEMHKNFVQMIEGWCDKNNVNLGDYELKTHSLNLSYHGFKFNDVFLIGEAAGLTLDFVGEGIYPAIVSGEIAAKTILDPKFDWRNEMGDLLKEKKLAHTIIRSVMIGGKSLNALSVNPKNVNRFLGIAGIGLSVPMAKDIIMKILFKKESR